MEEVIELIALALVIGGLCIALPLIIVWMTNKRKNHEIDKKTEILMTLMEKNPDLDPAEVMQKLNVSSKSHKTIKQKLLENVFSGGLMTLMGLAILIPHLCGLTFFGNRENGIFSGGIMLAMGLAFLIYYLVSKRQLKAEIEAEERRLKEQEISE